MKTPQVRAEYRRNGKIIRSRFYRNSERAQDQLAKRIGHFHYLGSVAGDTFERGVCTDAAKKRRAGQFGNKMKNKHAIALGRLGGKAKSEVKTAAVRRNAAMPAGPGKKRGRPFKKTTPGTNQ